MINYDTDNYNKDLLLGLNRHTYIYMVTYAFTSMSSRLLF